MSDVEKLNKDRVPFGELNEDTEVLNDPEKNPDVFKLIAEVLSGDLTVYLEFKHKFTDGGVFSLMFEYEGQDTFARDSIKEELAREILVKECDGVWDVVENVV